jgi:hypothetical protein
MRFEFAAYIKMLGAIASIFLTEFTSMFILYRAATKAESPTVLSAVAFPLFGVSLVFFLTAFHLTGNLERRMLRMLFFWIPAVLTCLLGFGLRRWLYAHFVVQTL